MFDLVESDDSGVLMKGGVCRDRLLERGYKAHPFRRQPPSRDNLEVQSKPLCQPGEARCTALFAMAGNPCYHQRAIVEVACVKEERTSIVSMLSSEST